MIKSAVCKTVFIIGICLIATNLVAGPIEPTDADIKSYARCAGYSMSLNKRGIPYESLWTKDYVNKMIQKGLPQFEKKAIALSQSKCRPNMNDKECISLLPKKEAILYENTLDSLAQADRKAIPNARMDLAMLCVD